MNCRRCNLKRQAGNYALFHKKKNTYCKNCQSIIYTGKPSGGRVRFSDKARKIARIARVSVNQKVRNGKIVRPDACSSCEKVCKPQAHHPDYSSRYLIVWLCTKCHSSLHVQMRISRMSPHKV